MQVLSGCGHAVHEDVPDKVAAIIAGYFLRHKLAQPKAGFQRYSSGHCIVVFKELKSFSVLVFRPFPAC